MFSQNQLVVTIKNIANSGRRFLTVVDVIQSPLLPASVILLRFDVERDLKHHADIAKLLYQLNVVGTFYFHTRKECYNAEILKKIEGFGHEIGYHYECLDRCQGDFSKARDLFLNEVALFRRDGFKLSTVCAHGEPGIRKNLYISNGDLLKRFPNLLSDAGLVGEVGIWRRSCPHLYASDRFSRYSSFWSTLNEGRHNPEIPLMVLVHLHRWRLRVSDRIFEAGQDILQHVSNRIYHKRKYNISP